MYEYLLNCLTLLKLLFSGQSSPEIQEEIFSSEIQCEGEMLYSYAFLLFLVSENENKYNTLRDIR